MRVAAADGKALQNIVIVETPKSFADAMSLLGQLASQASLGKKVDMVCGGVAGSFDQKKEKIVHSPNLSLWNGKNISGAIKKALKAKKVFLENDTAFVGLGEAVYGAGKKKPIVAYITISTGVNGVRVVDGRIDRSAMGFEIGHHIMGSEPKETFEYFAGAASLASRQGMGQAENISKQAWGDAERKIAVGVHNTLLYWSPDIIVLGGGSVSHERVSLKNIARDVKTLCKSFSHIPEIKKAQLDDLGGLYGALVFLNQRKSLK